jgi:hypothetical protein
VIKALNVTLNYKENYLHDDSHDSRFLGFLNKDELWAIAAAKLRGHYNYYGVTDNYRGILRFEQAVKRLLFKWLNRRGKRSCLKWEEFNVMLKRFPLPKPRIMVSMFGLPVNTM